MTKKLANVTLQNTKGKTPTLLNEVCPQGVVNLYSCGPTVYDFAHIGNFRSFLTSDLLERVLKYAGFTVNKAMNITDVGHLTADDNADATGEDKMLKKATAEGKTPWQIAEFYTQKFLEDEEVLRILPAKHRPKATDYIKEQIELAKTCIANGFAYESGGSVYFRTNKYEKYGSLSGNTLKNVQAGARVEINTEKEDPLDFALWKSAPKNHIMQWESPWGMGFPGWHAECSAMGFAIFDEIHVHTGGEDNIFPHHECECAQNAAVGFSEIPVWLHTKHLLVDGTKMSKSKGNFYTIRDLLEKGWRGAEIRLAMFSSHYRNQMNFTERSLHQARQMILRTRNAVRQMKQVEKATVQSEMAFPIEKLKEVYQKALFNDLNTPESLSIIAVLMTQAFKMAQANQLSAQDAQKIRIFLETDFDAIFNVLKEDKNEQITAEERQKWEPLLEKRTTLRTEKKYKEADEIRFQLEEAGFSLMDTPEGSVLIKK